MQNNINIAKLKISSAAVAALLRPTSSTMPTSEAPAHYALVVKVVKGTCGLLQWWRYWLEDFCRLKLLWGGLRKVELDGRLDPDLKDLSSHMTGSYVFIQAAPERLWDTLKGANIPESFHACFFLTSIQLISAIQKWSTHAEGERLLHQVEHKWQLPGAELTRSDLCGAHGQRDSTSCQTCSTLTPRQRSDHEKRLQLSVGESWALK